ncbi:hypothetical protein BBP40_010177 [Aspergillus hancockii]|nr:hypothetical protein BBP40_010177 [Aspergillus hancockii]
MSVKPMKLLVEAPDYWVNNSDSKTYTVGELPIHHPLHNQECDCGNGLSFNGASREQGRDRMLSGRAVVRETSSETEVNSPAFYLKNEDSPRHQQGAAQAPRLNLPEAEQGASGQ